MEGIQTEAVNLQMIENVVKYNLSHVVLKATEVDLKTAMSINQRKFRIRTDKNPGTEMEDLQCSKDNRPLNMIGMIKFVIEEMSMARLNEKELYLSIIKAQYLIARISHMIQFSEFAAMLEGDVTFEQARNYKFRVKAAMQNKQIKFAEGSTISASALIGVINKCNMHPVNKHEVIRMVAMNYEKEGISNAYSLASDQDSTNFYYYTANMFRLSGQNFIQRFQLPEYLPSLMSSVCNLMEVITGRRDKNNMEKAFAGRIANYIGFVKGKAFLVSRVLRTIGDEYIREIGSEIENKVRKFDNLNSNSAESLKNLQNDLGWARDALTAIFPGYAFLNRNCKENVNYFLSSEEILRSLWGKTNQELEIRIQSLKFYNPKQNKVSRKDLIEGNMTLTAPVRENSFFYGSSGLKIEGGKRKLETKKAYKYVKPSGESLNEWLMMIQSKTMIPSNDLGGKLTDYLSRQMAAVEDEMRRIGAESKVARMQ